MARRGWPLLERRLRPTRHLHQHFQGFDDRLLSHIAAADRAEPAFLVNDAAVARGNGEVNEANRFAGCRAAGACDAGDRNGEIDVGVFERAERHRGRGFLADRAERVENFLLHAEHRVLGSVRVGDEAAVDHIR